jgi:hypothetical protein
MIYLFFVLPCVIFFGIEIDRQVFFDFNYTVFLTKKPARLTIKCRNLHSRLLLHTPLTNEENAILFYGLDLGILDGELKNMVAVSVTRDFTQW